jgi:hypothetical protein
VATNVVQLLQSLLLWQQPSLRGLLQSWQLAKCVLLLLLLLLLAVPLYAAIRMTKSLI